MQRTLLTSTESLAMCTRWWRQPPACLLPDLMLLRLLILQHGLQHTAAAQPAYLLASAHVHLLECVLLACCAACSAVRWPGAGVSAQCWRQPSSMLVSTECETCLAVASSLQHVCTPRGRKDAAPGLPKAASSMLVSMDRCTTTELCTRKTQCAAPALLPRSAGCNTLRQWDLARAVPRHVRDVPLVKGDILGIATRPGAVYTCGADGSIRCARRLFWRTAFAC